MKAVKLLSVCALVVGLVALGAYAGDMKTFKPMKADAARPHIPGSAPAAWGNNCGDVQPLGTLTYAGGMIVGDTTGMTDDFATSGLCESYGTGGLDVIGSFDVDQAGRGEARRVPAPLRALSPGCQSAQSCMGIETCAVAHSSASLEW